MKEKINTAKGYLREIRKLDLYINQKQQEYDMLRRERTYIRGIDYSEDRVQTSPNGFSFTGMADKLADMGMEINREIDRFCDMRHERINQIQRLSKTEYVNILFCRYILYQSFERIASDMGYSYNYVCNLHGEALKEFESNVLNFY